MHLDEATIFAPNRLKQTAIYTSIHQSAVFSFRALSLPLSSHSQLSQSPVHSVCAHVRKHAVRGIRGRKKGEGEKERDGETRRKKKTRRTQSSEAKRRHEQSAKEDFHRFPIIPLIGWPIKFHGIVSPSNSSGRVRINSGWPFSRTNRTPFPLSLFLSLSLSRCVFDCSYTLAPPRTTLIRERARCLSRGRFFSLFVFFFLPLDVVARERETTGGREKSRVTR